MSSTSKTKINYDPNYNNDLILILQVNKFIDNNPILKINFNHHNRKYILKKIFDFFKNPFRLTFFIFFKKK